MKNRPWRLACSVNAIEVCLTASGLPWFGGSTLKRYYLIACLLAALILASGAASAQTMSASPTSVSLSAQANGTSVSTALSLANTVAGQSYSIFLSQPASWLTLSSYAGTTPATITVTANPASLSSATYSTTLMVYGGAAVLNVPVTFSVSSLSVLPTSLAFSYQLGGTVPAAQSLTVANTTSTTFTAAPVPDTGGSWLQVAPTSGTASSTSSVVVSAGLNSTIVASLPAGTYRSSVSVTPSGGTAVSIPVTLTVLAPAQVTPGSASLSFLYQTGGTANVVQQTLAISTTSATPMTYVLTPTVTANPSNLNWLSVSPASGTIPAGGSVSITVAVAPAALAAATYSGTITLYAPGATTAYQSIPVTLTVSATAMLNLPAAPLTFTYQIGTAAPSAQTVTPTSTTTATAIAFSLSAATASGGNWLSVSAATGTSGTPFTVSVSPSALPVGTYTGTITVTPTNGTAAQQITVVLTVSNEPVLTVSSSSLTYLYQTGETAPGIQTVKLSSSTGIPLTYTASATPSWLTVSSASGTTDATLSVAVTVSAMTAGTNYSGMITLTAINPTTGLAVTNSPLTIPVTVYASDRPMLVSSPASLAFTAQVSGSAPAAQTIALTSTSASTAVVYTATAATTTATTWLFVSQTSTSTPGTVVVTVLPSLLSAGTYSGTITIAATNASGTASANSPVTIPVTLTMTQGTMTVAPASLTFSQVAGGAAPASQTLSITTSNSTASTYSVVASSGSLAVAWLSATPTSGTTPGSVTVSADGSKLSAGQYTGTVTVTAAGVGGSPATIPVTLTVVAGTISATPASLTFTQVSGGTAPAAQTVTVSGTPSTLGYTVATAGGTWLTASQAAGTVGGTFTVSVSAGSLAAGTYNGSAVITAVGATGSPVTIPVTFTVAQSQTIAATPATLKFTYIAGQTAPAAQTFLVTSSGTASPVTLTVTGTSGGVTWLSATPLTGTTPQTVTVSVAPGALAAGTYDGSIVVSSASSSQTQTVAVSLTVSAIATPVLKAITNGASYAPGSVSPGENALIFGTGMGTSDTAIMGTVTTAGTLSTTVGNVRVLFDGIEAPIHYITATQTSVFVPYELAGRSTTTVKVEYSGVQSEGITYTVVPAVPGIYTQNLSGTGPGAILNQDYSVNGNSNGAAKGSYIAIYGTGEGATTPVGVTGSIIPTTGSGLKHPVLTPSVTIGGKTATVAYAGSAPGSPAGVFQVNVLVPDDAPSGSNAILITFGTYTTQAGVTVTVK
jgi:uncharacterized protein (TIGR03437 family)